MSERLKDNAYYIQSVVGSMPNELEFTQRDVRMAVVGGRKVREVISSGNTNMHRVLEKMACVGAREGKPRMYEVLDADPDQDSPTTICNECPYNLANKSARSRNVGCEILESGRGTIEED